MRNPCATCMVCGSNKLSAMYPVQDTNENVPGKWEIVSCEECGTGVLCPFPSDAEISSYYRQVFYNEEGKRFRGWMETLRHALASLRGRTINNLLPAKGRLLDYGSGAGHFAAAQTRAGWDVHSVDPYSIASRNAAACRVSDGSFELLYPDAHFDAVSLWYVIEHLRDPRAVIAELTRVLKPGGVMLLAQQDFASYQARVFGPKWLYLDPPRHIWQFTADSLIRLATQFRLRPIRKSWASIEMGPFCILQSTLNSILGNHNDLFRFLKNRSLSARDDREAQAVRPLPTIVSLLLIPVLGVLAFAAYYALLVVRSGDVVSIYFRKE